MHNGQCLNSTENVDISIQKLKTILFYTLYNKIHIAYQITAFFDNSLTFVSAPVLFMIDMDR